MANEFASVTSAAKPQAGQDHRSSGNFSTQNAPDQTKKYAWRVSQGGIENNTIRFNVKEDKRMAHDPVIFSGIGNGSITDTHPARSLYIADPDGAAGKDFLVEVFAR